MDRYEVMAGKMAPLTDGAHRKWGFTGKVETRSYERLVDALIDFVETGDGLKARFLTGFAACLAADRKSVENRGFGVAADRFARKCAAQGLWCSLHGLAVSDGSCEWVEISAC